MESRSPPSRTAAQQTGGAFRNGATTGSFVADFDPGYTPITSYSQGSSGGSYTVRAGDTLQSIAQQLYGDAGLWYKIAQANGITGDYQLREGQSLTLPRGVLRSANNADTYRAYDPASVIGDIGASDHEVEAALATYRQFGVTADVTPSARTVDLSGGTLQDVVVTGGSYENAFRFGSIGDPALIGAGAAASYISGAINDHPALRYALIGLDVAAGPVAFAARQALAASPVGQAIEDKVHEASDYISGQYKNQYAYNDADSRNAGIGAVTLAALGISGAAGALTSLGRLAGSEALAGPALARRLGIEGEQAVGITGPKVGITIPGTSRMRFPDRVTTTTLTEVKNVGYQGYTRQLRDYVAYAQDKGLTFELYVRQNTKISSTLLNAESRGEVIIRRDLPGR